MKKGTKSILAVLKVLAIVGGIWYSIRCGSQLLTFVASFINLDWAKLTYDANPAMFSILEQSTTYYVFAMSLIIVTLALKALIWYIMYDLLLQLKLQTPFSIHTEKKLEQIAYLLFAVWLLGSVFRDIYMHYLAKDTGIQLPAGNNADEYLFIAGIVYIISQVFKRGIEMQEENQLTV